MDRAAPVLVVEGDPLVASLIASQLELEDVPSVVAIGAVDGLEEAENLRLRAAAIELRLPGRPGWWLVTRIRGLMPRLPIVMITALADRPVLEQAAAMRCAVLVKPFSAGELHLRLAEAVELVGGLGNPHPGKVPRGRRVETGRNRAAQRVPGAVGAQDPMRITRPGSRRSSTALHHRRSAPRAIWPIRAIFG